MKPDYLAKRPLPHGRLLELMRDLAIVRERGQLGEFEARLSRFYRGPRCDSKRYPAEWIAVEELAQEASRIFDLCIEETIEAAAEVLLPDTRRTFGAGLLAEWAADCRGETRRENDRTPAEPEKRTGSVNELTIAIPGLVKATDLLKQREGANG